MSASTDNQLEQWAALRSASPIQNFFIILPGGSGPTSFDPGPHAGLVQAVQAALSGTLSAPPELPGNSVTLAEVGREWFDNHASSWAPSYALRLRNRLETGLLDHLGLRPISGVTASEVLEVIRRIEARDARETARRVLRIAGAVFRYGIATGRCARDPTGDLKGALKPKRTVQNRAFIPPSELPRFLKALSAYQGDGLTRLAMELIILTFVRTNELRFSTWSEFEDLDGADPVWRIPRERMKMRRSHLVPLSRQAVLVLREIRELNPASGLLFPASTRRRVISENRLLFALYRMGYRGRATVHGFRSLASTILNEAQFNRDWIETQLAHADNTVRGVYNTAEWLPGRRQMLQWWADYLDRNRYGHDPHRASF